MPQKLSWGVLSTAKIGTEQVIPAMQKSELTAVTAIASRDLSKARAAADRLGIAKAYGSYEELLADPEIEAVYNPLPNHLHVPLSLKAMEAGKHVLCEKPVALTAAEAEQLAECSARTGRLVAEAFMVRHHPQWQKAREIAKSGRLGEVRAVQTFFSFRLDDAGDIRYRPEMGGGGLYDVGCYAINTARYLFDGEPERVVGLFDIDPASRVDRMMSGLAEFSGQRHLVFTCGMQLVPTQRVEVVGTQARLTVTIPFNPVADTATTISIDDGRDLAGGGREVIELPPADHYRLQGDAFSRAIRGEERLVAGIDEAVRNMRVIDAFFRSGRSKGWEVP